MTDVFRTPDERFAGLAGWPHAPHYVEVLDGLRMAYADEGPADAPPVLLLHGEPTWSYLYRGVLPLLTPAGLRAVAPDHLGFGRSDKPTDVEWYSYDRHTAALTELVNALDLRGVTLVVQDWGGPLGLRWAMENPERVARIVILNTGLFSGREASEGLKQWLAYSRKQTDLDVGALVSASCGGLAPEVVAGYDAPYPTVPSKAGALAFPRLVPTQPGDAGADIQARVRTQLDEWDGPTQVAFSDGDPIFPSWVGESWAKRLRRTDPHVTISGAGHFLQEQQPTAVADVIRDFVARHPV